MFDSPVTVVLHQVGSMVMQGVIGTLIHHEHTVLLLDFHDRPQPFERSPVTVLKPVSRSVDALIEQLKGGPATDYIVINGVELLVDAFQGSELFARRHDYLNLRAFAEGQLAWEKLVPTLQALREALLGPKLVVLLNVDAESEERIAGLFEADVAVDVVSAHSQQPDEVFLLESLFAEIQNKPLDEALNRLDAECGTVPDRELSRLKAFVFLQHGLTTPAIEEFERQLENLAPYDRLLLADLYLVAKRPQEAFEQAHAAYEAKPFTRSMGKVLLKSLLAILRNSGAAKPERSAVSDWVERSLRLEGDNPEVLDLAANCLNQVALYAEAAQLRRRLRSITADPYQELLARFLDLQVSPPASHTQAQQRILEWVDQYPQLEDEAHYRLGMMMLHHYKSSYMAFEHWDKVTTSPACVHAYDAAVQRLSLLRDNLIAAKVLRLNPDREPDEAKLAARKTQELLRDMEILSTRHKGYMVWSEYLDRWYTQQTWTRQLLPALLRQVADVSCSIGNGPVPESYLKRVSAEADAATAVSPMAAVQTVRKLKGQELPHVGDRDTAYQVMQGALICCEMNGDLAQRVWGRYQVAVLSSLLGRDQDAINHAISLFDIANGQGDEAVLRIARMLGFFAFSSAQYRLGNKVEGIACLLAGMQLSVQTGEYGALVEEGLNLLYRFLMDDVSFSHLPEADQTTLLNFVYRLSEQLDDLATQVRISAMQGNYPRVYELLHDVIYGQEDHDGEWAVHLTNFIAACNKTERWTEASRLVFRHADEAVRLLSQRLDLLPQLLHSWASLQVHKGDGPLTERLRQARRLLQTAVGLDDIRRGSLYYKSERAHLAEIHRKIAVKYIEILALIHQANDFPPEDRYSALQDLLGVMALVNPRSILESRRHDEVRLTPELVALERRYAALAAEITALETNHPHKEELTRRFDALRSELQASHPYYKALPRLNGNTFETYRHLLREHEVFLQYVVTDLGMVVLTVDRRGHKLDFCLFPVTKYRDRVSQLGLHLQETSNPTVEDSEKTRALAKIVSAPIVRSLRQALGARPEEAGAVSVYLCPDLTLPLFSANLLVWGSEWLVQRVGKVANLMDFSQLSDRHGYGQKASRQVVLVATVGSAANPAIKKAREQLRAWESRANLRYIDLTNNDQEVRGLVEECRSLCPRAVVIIGHGLRDEHAGRLSGAAGIEGYKHTIWAEDLNDLSQSTDHLILITCSSGVAYPGQAESSTGVWNGMLSENFFGVILGRWDVDVRGSLELLDQVLTLAEQEPSLPVPELFCLAQRSMITIDTWSDPLYWAGMEYWGF